MSSRDLLHMPRLAQVGLVVRDMESTIRRFEEVFGIGPWLVLEGETAYCLDRGRETTLKGRIAMGYSGSIQLELIQILEGDSFHLHTLGDRKEGLHHLGFAVDNLEERLEAARAAGIGILQRGTLKQLGMTIDYAYLDTLDSVGVILEFIQTRFLGLKARQYPWLLKLAALSQKHLGFPRPSRS
ncbi:VOC family protein [Candidatus Solincola sp.]|jgi:methylmalonyl-CoA/ethylmalonyl-CoA epimerase|nr:VOC family protein [Actinomycetota bacterium]MDI7252817.1 VOC family protein [Actinomycetota bacterium]